MWTIRKCNLSCPAQEQKLCPAASAQMPNPYGKETPFKYWAQKQKIDFLTTNYPLDFLLFCAGLLLPEFCIDSTFTHLAKVHFCKFVFHFRTKMSANGIQICGQCLFYGTCHCSVYAKSRQYPVSEKMEKSKNIRHCQLTANQVKY